VNLWNLKETGFDKGLELVRRRHTMSFSASLAEVSNNLI